MLLRSHNVRVPVGMESKVSIPTHVAIFFTYRVIITTTDNGDEDQLFLPEEGFASNCAGLKYLYIIANIFDIRAGVVYVSRVLHYVMSAPTCV